MARNYKSGFFADLTSKDLGLGLERANATAAKTGVERENRNLCGQARVTGLDTLDTSGTLGLLEPRKL